MAAGLTGRRGRRGVRLAPRRALAWPGWRAALFAGALVAALLVPLWVAWGVLQARREHERSVDAALREYARYAARSVGDQIMTGSRILRWQLLGPVAGVGAADPGLAGYTDAVRRRLERATLAADSLRGVFRLDLRTGRYEGWGVLADGRPALDARAAFERRMAALNPAMPTRIPDDPRAVIVPTADGPAYVIFGDVAPVDGETVTMYGIALSRRFVLDHIGQNVERPALLPPSTIAPGWNPGESLLGADTLVAIRIEERPWGVLYRSEVQFTSAASGTYAFEGVTSGIRVTATLHPALAASLRAGYLRQATADVQLLRALLAAALAGAAALLLRRERQLARARRDFVASVSHELRTPLAQIRMFSETLLLRREHDEEERLRWLAVIGREARRLGDLVENILLFSHVDAARMRLEPERTDLGELAEEVVEAYVPIAGPLRMRLVADAPSRIYARVDPRAMRQVVVNLLDNALKYGPSRQTVTLQVEAVQTSDGAVARLRVSDEGPGVPAADRVRIWRPFDRGSTAGGTAPGSGIGLGVVRAIVEHHGGRAHVEDAPGGGARFVVLLPLEPEAATAEGPAVAAVAARDPARHGAPVASVAPLSASERASW